MSKQYKTVELKSATATPDGHTISGVGNVTGYLDSGGDIVLSGAYTDTVDATLKDGFIADGHGWSYGDQLGYFTAASETPDGFTFTAAFHDTPDAQAAYAKARARIDAGKSVFLSIGYSTNGARYLDPQDYETELPKLLKPEYVEEGMKRALGMPWGIRVLSAVQVHEVSLVGVAMNAESMATAIKTGGLPAGVSYTDERAAVMTALRAWIERTEDKCRLRVQDKGRLSAAGIAALQSDAADLVAMAERLKSQAETATADPKTETETAPHPDAVVNVEAMLTEFEARRVVYNITNNTHEQV